MWLRGVVTRESLRILCVLSFVYGYAPLAQLVEQLTLNQRAPGSSPWWRTISFFYELWPVGQAVKTPASHAGNTGSIPVRVTNIAIVFCA